jgi:membrane-associated phospholipid phosphatase
MSRTSMPDASSAEPGIHWCQRFRALWRTKLCLTFILNVWFWGVYLFLSRHAIFPCHALPLTFLDRWAGFRPYPWAWIYESNFLITGIIPWLTISQVEIRRYATGFLALSALSFLVFVLFPVASPRPHGLEENATLIFITHVDGPLNAFPSLHAGCLVYTIALARRLFGRQLHPAVLAMLLVWAALILFATLATKQHYAVDLLAGGLLGWAADWFAWRHAGRDAIASTSNRRRSGVASHTG